MDDGFKVTVEQYCEYLVTRCETLICKADDQVAGIAIFSELSARSGLFIGWIAPEFREGFANQKVTRSLLHGDVLDYAWSDLKLIRLEARCHPSNSGAMSLLANLGFSYVGTCRADMLIDGTLSDTLLWDLVNPDYQVVEDLPVKERTSKLQETSFGLGWNDDEDEDDATGAETEYSLESDGAESTEPEATSDDDDEPAVKHGTAGATGAVGFSADSGWTTSRPAARARSSHNFG